MSRIHSFLCVEQPLAYSFKMSPRVGRACSLVNFLSIVHFAFLNSSNISCFFCADTTREPREGEENGKGYNFVSREEMEQDIRAGKYLEHGDYEGNLYGTKVDSIREVMRSGKMCILDVNSTVRKSRIFNQCRAISNCVLKTKTKVIPEQRFTLP